MSDVLGAKVDALIAGVAKLQAASEHGAKAIEGLEAEVRALASEAARADKDDALAMQALRVRLDAAENLANQVPEIRSELEDVVRTVRRLKRRAPAAFDTDAGLEDTDDLAARWSHVRPRNKAAAVVGAATTLSGAIYALLHALGML